MAFGTFGTSWLALCTRDCLPGAGMGHVALWLASCDSSAICQLLSLGWLEIFKWCPKTGGWEHLEAEHVQLCS